MKNPNIDPDNVHTHFGVRPTAYELVEFVSGEVIQQVSAKEEGGWVRLIKRADRLNDKLRRRRIRQGILRR